MAGNIKAVPEGYNTVTPYLIVDDGNRALEFYRRAFGATELFRMPRAGGKIGHAEISIGNSRIMLADEHAEVGARSPRSIGGSPVSLLLYVEDVDAFVEKAVAAGARLAHPIENKFYGDRMGALEDPFGYQWHIATHIEDVPLDELKRRASAVK